MGFTIYTREQVTPKHITVHGAYADQTTLNNPTPVYPPGCWLLFAPPTLDIYSSDPAVRKVLLADPAGETTLLEAVAAFPGYLELLLNNIRGEATQHILKTYPLWYQTNVALGIYGQPVADKMRDDIVAVIVESNRCEQLIFDGQPYVLNLPTIGA